jgi:hypothetical protein
MPESQIHGKSIQAIAKDVAEGFFFVNPLMLKKFESEDYKALHHQLKKLQNEVRAEKFPLHNTLAIRSRNSRLQRLHNALIVLEHSARERRVAL